MKKFIKNNKVTTIAFIICVIFIICIFMVKLTFFPNEAKAIYGNRLEGIDKVEITEKQQNKIVSALEKKDEVKKASSDIRGRILNIVITVNDETSLDQAKALSTTITENLKKDQLSYYDIEVFIKKNSDDASFPIIGQKHQNKDSFSFTKDR